MSDTIVASSARTITVILPVESGGVAKLRNAFCSRGIESFITHRTRGALPGCPVDAKGVPIWQEMIILEAVIPDDLAESIFRAVYETGIHANAEGGLLFMGKLGRAAFTSRTEDHPLDMGISLSADDGGQKDAGETGSTNINPGGSK